MSEPIGPCLRYTGARKLTTKHMPGRHKDAAGSKQLCSEIRVPLRL